MMAMDKDEKRKLRNRQAAQRSYQKKKSEHEELEKMTAQKEERQIKLNRQIAQLKTTVQTYIVVAAGIKCIAPHGSRFPVRTSDSSPPGGRYSSNIAHTAPKSSQGQAFIREQQRKGTDQTTSLGRNRKTPIDVARHNQRRRDSGGLQRAPGPTGRHFQSMTFSDPGQFQETNNAPLQNQRMNASRVASTQFDKSGTAAPIPVRFEEAMTTDQDDYVYLEFVQRSDQGVVTQPQSTDENPVFTFTGNQGQGRMSRTRPEGLLACPSSSAPPGRHLDDGGDFSKLVPSGEGYRASQPDVQPAVCNTYPPELLNLLADIDLTALNCPEIVEVPPSGDQLSVGPPVEVLQPAQDDLQSFVAYVPAVSSASAAMSSQPSRFPLQASCKPAQMRTSSSDCYVYNSNNNHIANPTPCSDLATTGWKMEVEKKAMAVPPETVTGLQSFPAHLYKKIEMSEDTAVAVLGQNALSKLTSHDSCTEDMIFDEDLLFHGTKLQQLDMRDVQELHILDGQDHEMTSGEGTQLSSILVSGNSNCLPGQFTTAHPSPLQDEIGHPNKKQFVTMGHMGNCLTSESAGMSGNPSVSHGDWQRAVGVVRAKTFPGKTPEVMTGYDDDTLTQLVEIPVPMTIDDVNVKLKTKYQ